MLLLQEPYHIVSFDQTMFSKEDKIILKRRNGWVGTGKRQRTLPPEIKLFCVAKTAYIHSDGKESEGAEW